MSLATASCDLWQNEQRNISSVPVLFFTRLYSFVNPLSPAPMQTCRGRRDRSFRAETARKLIGRTPIIPLSRLIDDIVYDSVFLSLLGIHNEVALHIFFDLFQLLT